MYTEWKADVEQAVAVGRRQLPVYTEWKAVVNRLLPSQGLGYTCGYISNCVCSEVRRATGHVKVKEN